MWHAWERTDIHTGKPKEKRRLERPMFRRQDNIKMNIKETGL
jgi:hypothetical protein